MANSPKRFHRPRDHRPPKTSDHPAPERQEHPFVFRVHRSLDKILDKIGVPEPQPFVPDPFQIEALEALDSSDVLVTAPTGAGKTYIAVEAIERISAGGGRSWYASPLKALSNAKYEEFSRLFGPDRVGILTGDRKENTQAPIIVGTTEILRNQLYDAMHRGENLQVDLVVLDEAHYLGDRDRGVVWEEVLIYLPQRVRLLLLSATVHNARQICGWLESLRKTSCTWVAAYERPVPLFPLFLFPNGELSPLSTRKGVLPKVRTVEQRSFSRNEFPNIPAIMHVLREANLLPAIFFLKSRADCERAITFCPDISARNRKDARRFKDRLEDYLESFPFLRSHQHLSILKSARVGAHHGGQLPHWKLLLETMMQEGFLDAIFSTSTVAAGVNFPARSVVILQSDKFNGMEFVPLSATDLLQMTGRAGRRGMDEIGFVLVVPGPHQDPQWIHDQLRAPPDAIESQIRVNFSMVLNLLLSHSPEEIRTLFGASLATYQNLSKETEAARKLEEARQEIERWVPDVFSKSQESLDELKGQYEMLKEEERRTHAKERRSEDSFLSLVAPGRIFLTQRGVPYVAVAHPDMEVQSVDAIRLAYPLRFRKGRMRVHRVSLHRIRDLGEALGDLPELENRGEWEILASRLAQEPPQSIRRKSGTGDGEVFTADAAARELADRLCRKSSSPAGGPFNLFGCRKPVSRSLPEALKEFFEHRAHIENIQEQLWTSFLEHYRILQDEGYVTAAGSLTEDGLWASKLRLDQPLLISESIRKDLFPSDDPELLAGLIALFVTDRERSGEKQLAQMVGKFPELEEPYRRILETLQPLRDRLQDEGFSTPPLPFWTLATIIRWAHGATWEEAREIAGMDEGDLAMVILRTADHLRQVESLAETHPHLADSARKAVQLILREPVLME